MTVEQWRYCCPECGSPGLVSRTNLGGYRCEVYETVVEQRHYPVLVCVTGVEEVVPARPTPS